MRATRTIMALGAALVVGVSIVSTGTAGAATTGNRDRPACPESVVPVGTFDDVATGSVHGGSIDCVAWWEITLGRSPGTFDPGGIVTRGQLAAFLDRVILATVGHSTATFPDAFDDDDGHLHERSINSLAARGIMLGVGGSRSAPSDQVTRGQAASLVRGTLEFLGEALAKGADAFQDDSDNVHEAAINSLASLGIVQGTSPTEFSPQKTLQRAPMASILAGALDHLTREGLLDPEELHWFDRLFESGRWQLAMIVCAYAAVIWITTRVLIAGPIRQTVIEQVERERSLLAVMEAESDLAPNSTVDAINRLLDIGERSVSLTLPGRRPDRRRITSPLLTLTRVLTARRYLHDAQLLRVRAFPQDHVALADLSRVRLRRSGIRHGEELAKQLDRTLGQYNRSTGAKRDRVASDLRVYVTEAISLWWQDEDLDLEQGEDAQRRTLWLVSIGLTLVFVLGLYGHRPTLLFGALGGFLSPLIRVRWRRLRADEYGTSWGVLLLSPVAGALTAYAGILLVTLLTSPDVKLLGDAFEEAGWDNSHSSISLTLAVLFGFSARLFSSLALSAAGAVTSATADGTGGEPADDTQPAASSAQAGEGRGPVKKPEASDEGENLESAPTRPRQVKAGRGLGASRTLN